MCVCIFFFFFTYDRHSLFGGSSVKMIDADLSRLYTATSLMQIDDNIMRYVEGRVKVKLVKVTALSVVDVVVDCPYLSCNVY